MRRIIISGGTEFNDYEYLKEIMDKILWLTSDYDDAGPRSKAFFGDVELVSGHARGVNTMAERYAKERNKPIKVFSAQWNKYGKAAGPIRNREMLDYAMELEEANLVAFWNGKSRGTKNMIEIAKKAGIGIDVILVEYGGVNGKAQFPKWQRCPLCGEYLHEEPATYDICPICNWEDDRIHGEVEPSGEIVGPNYISFEQAKRMWKQGLTITRENIEKWKNMEPKIQEQLEFDLQF